MPETNEFEYVARVPIGELSDEDSSREADESEYHLCMPINEDRGGYTADPASGIDSPRRTHMLV